MSWLDLKMRPTSFGDNKRKPSTAFVELAPPADIANYPQILPAEYMCAQCLESIESCRCPLP